MDFLHGINLLLHAYHLELPMEKSLQRRNSREFGKLTLDLRGYQSGSMNQELEPGVDLEYGSV